MLILAKLNIFDGLINHCMSIYTNYTFMVAEDCRLLANHFCLGEFLQNVKIMYMYIS